MQTIPEVGLNKLYINETDLFFDKITFVTLSEKVIRILTGILNHTATQPVTEGAIDSATLINLRNIYDPKSNTLSIPSYLVDSFLDLKQKANFKAILSRIIENASFAPLEKLIKENKISLEETLFISEIENKDISVGLVGNKIGMEFEKDNFPIIPIKISSKELEERSCIDGVNISYKISIHKSNLNYLLSNLPLNSKKTSGSFRFYRATVPPVDSYGGFLFGEGYWEYKTPLLKFDFKLITEEDYNSVANTDEFKRIKKKGDMYMDKRNFKDSFSDLVPGHVYILPGIKSSLIDSEIDGCDYFAQLLYLGRLITRNKPDNNWGRTKYVSTEHNLECLGITPFYRTNKARINRFGEEGEISSFRGGKRGYVCDKELHIFLNIGQFAKYRKDNANFYTIDESALNTKENFTETFINEFLPSLLQYLILLGNKRLPQRWKSWIKHYSTLKVNSSNPYMSKRSSLLSTNSPILLTIDRNEYKSIQPSYAKLPNFIDLGELFDGTDFSLEEFFNKITVKTFELFDKEGLKFYESNDSVIKRNGSTIKANEYFVYSDLPFLPWATPELYNSNSRVKQAIIGSLKEGIKAAGDFIINVIPKIINFEKDYNKYQRPHKFKVVVDGLIDKIKSTRTDSDKILNILEYNSQVFGYHSTSHMDPISEYSFYNVYNDIYYYGVNLDYVSDLVSLVVKKKLNEFCDIVCKIGDTWEYTKILHNEQGVNTDPSSGSIDQFMDSLKGSNISVIQDITNLYYNWFAENIYECYKDPATNLFPLTELLWIDKFDIKKEELLGYNYDIV